MCTWTLGTDAGQGAIVWVDPAQVSGTAWLLAVCRSLLEPTLVYCLGRLRALIEHSL